MQRSLLLVVCLGCATSGGSTTSDAGSPDASDPILIVEPAPAPLTSVEASRPTQAFTASLRHPDGRVEAVTTTWLSLDPRIGQVDDAGLFEATGTRGGQVVVRALHEGLAGEAVVTIDAERTRFGDAVPG